METLKIVIVDDEPVCREGLRSILSREAGLEVAGEAESARAGFPIVDRVQPTVVLLALRLPGMDGAAAIREIRRRCTSARILAFSRDCVQRELLEALTAGAHGIALKQDRPEELVEALKTVALGGRHLSRGLPRGVAAALSTTAQRASEGITNVLDVLSVREREIFALLIRGFSNREIASELCIGYKTVETHRRRINEKLGCRSGADLIRFAALNQLLRPELH